MKIIKKILLFLNVLTASLLIITYLSVWNQFNNFFDYICLFSFIYVKILLVNIIFIAVWLIIDWKYSLISIITIAVGYKFLLVTFPLNSYVNPSSSETNLKIMSYNVNLFGLYDWRDNLSVKSKIIKLIKTQDPDIICIQEAYWNDKNKDFVTIDSIKNILKTNFNYKFAIIKGPLNQNFGLVTISKFPIINSQSHRFEDSKNGFIYNDILFNEDTIRVYNCHLESMHISENIKRESDNNINFDKNKMDIKHLEKLAKNTIFRSSLKTYKNLKYKRDQQSEIIKNALDSCSYKQILCGDLNDISLSKTYFNIAGNLNDSYSYRGKYPGNTWENFKMNERIDYILYDTRIKCSKFEVLKENFSDHYAITSELLIK